MILFSLLPTPAQLPAPQQIDQVAVGIGPALERVQSWIDGAVRRLPNIVTALILMTIFFVLAVVVRRLVMRQFGHRGNLGEVLGAFLKWVVLILGFLIAATIVIPSRKPGDLIAGLGVSSVAVGFAFKDILQNWLAGLLILLRQPFVVGDQREVNGFEGTVEKIETRATLIRTYDGQRAVVPNSDIYTNALLVKTAFEFRRSQYDVGIGYGDDIDAACETIVKAVQSVEGVQTDPAPEALPWDLAASWVTIRARWWTSSVRTDVAHTQSRVIRAIKLALDEARIDMPYETRVHLSMTRPKPMKAAGRSSARAGQRRPQGRPSRAGRRERPPAPRPAVEAKPQLDQNENRSRRKRHSLTSRQRVSVVPRLTTAVTHPSRRQTFARYIPHPTFNQEHIP